jgi:acyl dehydratase
VPLHLTALGDLKEYEDKDLGTSSWLTITQERVNTFADATDDHQWIHVDPERARAESPFGAPIAHGYLTLSLIIPMWTEILAIDSVRTSVNYGLNKVRFINPVPVGGRIRLHARLAQHQPISGGAQITVTATVELAGEGRPACVAEAVYRLYE